MTGNKIYIRPDNRLSRTLSNKWLKFLLIITFIFPFVWLFKRFNKKGGGRWEVCGGAWALKRLLPVTEPDTVQGKSAPTLFQSPDGQLLEVKGMNEGQWLQMWQATIVQAANNRYQSTIPLTQTTAARLAGIPMSIVHDLI